MNLLANISWGQWLLAILVTFVCLFLMLVILLQRGRGTGLVGAFGGGGSSAFGAKTGDVFTWITVVVAAVFFLLVIVGNFIFDMSALARPEAPVAQSPTAPESAPLQLPIEPTGAPMSTDSSTKRFPIKLEQVPVDPGDPSKGTTFHAVPLTPEEAAKMPKPSDQPATPPADQPTPPPGPPASPSGQATPPAGEAAPPTEAQPQQPPSAQPAQPEDSEPKEKPPTTP